MRLPLIPREEKFFDLFLDDAQNVLAGARLLEQFFRNYDERERLASQLRDAEHAGDQISHDIGHKLEKTFVTPFDREDIHALISRLDDIIDFIEEVADTCILYGIDKPSPVAVQQAEIIVRQCEQLTAALGKLRKFKDLEQHLDRDPSARERGRPHRPPGHGRAVQERPGPDRGHQVEGRLRPGREGDRCLRGCRQRDRAHRRQACLRASPGR